MNISFSKIFLFGLITLIIIVMLAIYSIKLTLGYIQVDDEEQYGGFYITEIEESN